MEGLLEPGFLRRLRSLRDRLGRRIRALEFVRAGPSGHLTIPEIESHRPYTSGDDPRYLDWSLFARQDRFFLKTMVREEEGLLDLLVDVSASMRSPRPEKMERAMETAAGLAYLALVSGIRVRVLAWSDRLLFLHEHAGGEREIGNLLWTLVNLPRGEGTDLGRSLGNLLSRPGPPRSWMVVLSDFIDVRPYRGEVEFFLSRGVRLGAIQVLHPEETRPLRRGNLALRDPESGATARRQVGYRTAREFARITGTFLRETETLFALRGARFSRCRTDLPFEDVVTAHLLASGRED